MPSYYTQHPFTCTSPASRLHSTPVPYLPSFPRYTHSLTLPAPSPLAASPLCRCTKAPLLLLPLPVRTPCAASRPARAHLRSAASHPTRAHPCAFLKPFLCSAPTSPLRSHPIFERCVVPSVLTLVTDLLQTCVLHTPAPCLAPIPSWPTCPPLHLTLTCENPPSAPSRISQRCTVCVLCTVPSPYPAHAQSLPGS